VRIHGSNLDCLCCLNLRIHLHIGPPPHSHHHQPGRIWAWFIRRSSRTQPRHLFNQQHRKSSSLSLYVINGIHPYQLLKIVPSPSPPPTYRYWSQNYPTSCPSNDLRCPDTQRVRKRQHNRRCELTRLTVPPNGENQPTRVLNPARVGHPHVRVIAGRGEVAVGVEEAMGEAPRGKNQLQHPRTTPSPPPSSWLILPLPPIPQQNPLRSPSQTPDRNLREGILRRCRRTRSLFPPKRVRGLQTDGRNLNKESHRTVRANSLTFKPFKR